MSWVLVLAAAVVLYIGLVVIGLWLAWRNPRVAPRRTPAALGIPFEDVWIPTANRRRLHGWWMPADSERRPSVILVHGWGRNAERMLPYVSFLRPLGFHLLAFDARHHGLSDADGFASMKKFSEDIRATAEFLAGKGEVDAGRLGVVGLSIGGAAALHAAAHDRRLVAVVTVGAFAHPADATLDMLPFRRLFRPAWPVAMRWAEWRVGARFADLAPERQIGRIRGKVLLIHGENDATVPVSHARRLAHEGHAQLWLIAGRGHSDPHLEPGFADRVRRFLADALCPAPPATSG